MTTVFITIGIAAAAVLLLAAIVVTIIVCSTPDIDEGVDQDSGDLGIQRSALFTEDAIAVPTDRGGRHRPENVQLVPPNYLITEIEDELNDGPVANCNCEDCEDERFAEITVQLDLVDEVQQ